MKIKADFVTNSSSTMYVIEFDKVFLRKDFEEFLQLRTGEYFKFFNEKIKLITFTQQEDVDWITEATKTPYQFRGMDKSEFDEAISILDKGKFVVYMQFDRNYGDRRDEIDFILIDNGGIIRHTASD